MAFDQNVMMVMEIAKARSRLSRHLSAKVSKSSTRPAERCKSLRDGKAAMYVCVLLPV